MSIFLRKKLLKFDINRRKVWFVTVRSARELNGLHRRDDDFSNDENGLRTWGRLNKKMKKSTVWGRYCDMINVSCRSHAWR
mmetsp:Transcript_2253/g.2430  ORF Transcript_2253/g.2430 Transcript_2253/m.2430 type:complete len:81 (+) Transcript_2253:375-617(+)